MSSKSAPARPKRNSADLNLEIDRIEQEIQECELELSSVGGDVALGQLFRVRTRRLQLEAYLQGLRFALR